jgi:CRP/FNR family cyclic AMP-dependent transcriptional regulator
MSEQPDYRVIRQSPLGQELSDEECRTLASIMEIRRLRDGEILVREGEANSSMHIVTAGQLAVTTTTEEGETVTLYVLKTGEFAGTRAFVDRTPRKATLRAMGESEVYVLDPDPFEALLGGHPHLVFSVMRAIFRTVHNLLMRIDMENAQLLNYINRQHGRY